MIESAFRRKPPTSWGVKILGVLAMAAALSAQAEAGAISFSWFVEPYTPIGGGPAEPDQFLVYGQLSIAPDFYFADISFDAPQNAFGERLELDDVPGSGHFSWNVASNGGSAFYPLTILVIPPGARPGLYDRHYLTDGSWRPSTIRIAAYYAGPNPEAYPEGGELLSVPFDFSVLDQSGGPGGDPGVVPEPASLAMATVAAAGVAALLRRRRTVD